MPYLASEGRSLHLVADVVSDASAGHHLAGAHQTSSVREVLLTIRCQFFLGVFAPLLEARTLAALALHPLLGREAYAIR